MRQTTARASGSETGPWGAKRCAQLTFDLTWNVTPGKEAPPRRLSILLLPHRNPTPSLQIFVADDEYTGSSISAEAKTQRWRKALDLPPLGASPLDDPNLRSERLSGARKSAASAAGAPSQPREPPTWWETAPPAYVPEAQREVWFTSLVLRSLTRSAVTVVAEEL